MNETANVAAASSAEPVVGEHEQGERDAGDLVAGLAGHLGEDEAAELADGEDVARRRRARAAREPDAVASALTRRTPSPPPPGPAA